MKEILGEKCYTAKEVAEITGMSVYTTRKRCRNGEIRFFRIGYDLYIKESALREFTDGLYQRKNQQPGASDNKTTEDKQ